MSIRTNVIEQLRQAQKGSDKISYSTSWGTLIARAVGSRLGDMTVWSLRTVAVAGVLKLFGIV